uniref:Uncharacterized protein n=1 Tax=Caenorhabditis japonica TaxID=281687 RepID=A0A8R1EF35_CAEJA
MENNNCKTRRRSGMFFIFNASLEKSSQVINKVSSKAPEYVLELDGGPILPHCTKLVALFLRNAELCEQSVSMSVSDRHSSNGMNGWTDRATNWNCVKVFPNHVTRNKNAC